MRNRREVLFSMHENIKKRKGHWESFGDIDGLGHYCVAFLEDTKGNLWIATAGSGLSRYDGKKFVNFTNKHGLISNSVKCLHQDTEGNIWIGTSDGISQYDGEEFVSFTQENGLIDNDVNCIFQDREGNIWIGTESGISQYDGEKFVDFKDDRLSGKSINYIFQDTKGNIWIGIWDGGVVRYDGVNSVCFTQEDGLISDRVNFIYQDRCENIWIGTSQGLSIYDGTEFVNFTQYHGLIGNDITCLCEDIEGNIWIGVWASGVSCYDGEKFVNFTMEDGLAYIHISDIIQDREKNIWFACGHGGISKYNPYCVIHISDEAVNEVIINDRDDNVWWGFGSILSQFNGESINHYPFESKINEIFEDSKGRFWIGVEGQGIFRYENTKAIKEKNPENLTVNDGLAGNDVWRIYEDREGNLWIGTNNGVSRYDGLKFANFSSDDGLGTNFVSVICQDRNGKLWFAGFFGGGITSYDGKDFRNYTEEDGLLSNPVQYILVDDKNNLWIGTNVGISYFDGNSFKNYTTEDGLLGSFVQRMFRDSRGQLWIATLGGGVNRFDGKNFQVLTNQDVLPSNNVTGIVEDSDGSLIISTYQGICRYVPDCNISPLIEIDEVVTDNIYKQPKYIKISENASSIEIKYHGISFKTKKMRYNYILEGYDKCWKYTWDEEVRYEDIPPGEYKFKVIAINRDLVYSENPAELEIIVIADIRNQVINELEQKVREKNRELQKTNDRLNTLIEAIPDIIYFKDARRRNTVVNKAFENLVGMDKEDILGKTDEQLFPQDLARQCLKSDDETIKRGKPVRFEEQVADNSGNRIFFETIKSPIFDEQGNIRGLVGISRDITKRKQTENALKKSEEKYSNLFHYSNDGIFLHDLQGNIIDVNQKVLDQFGYTKSEILSLKVKELHLPEDAEKSRWAFEKATREGFVNFEINFKKKNGEIFIAEVSSSLFEIGGKEVLQGIVRDITERKQAEEKIKASLKEKEVLLREIHHRVKNNMQVISSLLRLQSRQIYDDKYNEMFRESQNRIKSMALVHEKLYQSKDLATVNFSGFVRSLTNNLFRTYVNTDNITLNIDVEDVSLPINSAIPCGLIINELVSNSLKYAFVEGKKGEINISLRYLTDDKKIELVVGDNGISISEDLDYRNTESLGLQLVMTLVKQLHAEIELDRTEGTEFRIKFGK